MRTEPHPTLRSKLGSDGLLELNDVLQTVSKEWKPDVIETATARFDQRLTDEMSTFRSEVSREFAALRVEIARLETTVIRWLFGILITLLTAGLGMMTFLLNALKG